MYLAEVLALQGCMAWGKTPAETLHELMDVARMLIELRKENGELLPKELISPSSDKGSLTVTAQPTENCGESWKVWAADSSAKAGDPPKCGSTPQTGGGPPSPGSATVTWPPALFTK